MPETSEYTRLGDGGNQSLFGRWQYLTRLEKGLIFITTVFGIVIFSLAVALAKCDAQVTPTPSPNVTTVAPVTTTVPSSTTEKPTTVAPISSTVAPTSSTVAPDTTTVAPDKTTVAPDLTTVAPDSTTVAPDSTTVAPISSTVAPISSTVAPISSSVAPNETENTSTANMRQLNQESTISLDTPISENTTKSLKSIPPIPITGIKLIFPQTDETITNKNLAEKENTSAQIYSEAPENNTENSKDTSSKHPILSRKKRIDTASIAEGKKDNPIYE